MGFLYFLLEGKRLSACKRPDDEGSTALAVADAEDIRLWLADERSAWRLGESQLADNWVVSRDARKAHREEDEIRLDNFLGMRS